ncbi:hypothetical protein [Frigoribacterium salinisoli]
MATDGQRKHAPVDPRAVVAAACSVLLLTGCSSIDDQDILTDDGRTSSSDAPLFSGPWAAEFTSAYQEAESDFVRAVLEDELITDQELSEMRDKFTECLSAYALTDVVFDDDGSFSLNEPDDADFDTVNDQVHGCSVESGELEIGALHSWIRRNPDNQDENTIMAACLVRKGVVEPSYSADQYAEDYADDDFPYTDPTAGEEADLECNADPLGLYE